MAYGTKVAFEAVRELDAASVGATYSAIGSATANHTRNFRIVSTLDQEVYISIDGINNHIRMPTTSFELLDLVTNEVTEDGFFLPQGTTFYVKRVSAAPTTGSIWVEIIYAQGGI